MLASSLSKRKMEVIHYSIFLVTMFLLELSAVQGMYQHGAPVNMHHIVKRSVVECDCDARYRSIDGQCNNLDNPQWGSVGIPLDRMLPSAYRDGVSSPRTMGVGGQMLPSTRKVSLNCHPRDDATQEITIMYMHFGQFLDHDISLTPKGPTSDCPCNSTSTECLAIPLSNDEYFKTRACLEFKRSNSIQATDDHHSMPVRQQLNVLTAYIDGSSVYGSTEEQLASLRGNSAFELKVATGCSGKDFLPANPTASNCRPGRGEYCYLAGDPRVNVQPGLAAHHTLFVREHNRIAQILHARTRWSDEEIFQEARKIVGAIMQRITYNEYLPMTLGPDFMTRYDLDLSRYRYNSSLKADVLNSFATAAFRFSHSQIPENLDLSCTNTVPFKQVFFKPHPVITSFDKIFSTGAIQKSTGSDRFFAHSVSRHLFEPADQMGSDLAALNMQRGRDHGLPSYNHFRQLCGLPNITSLDDLFPGDPLCAGTYDSIDDVDLFSGAMAETPVEGGLVGPTFACILAEQFHRLKSGDRFFYLNQDPTVGFTHAQITQINQVTFSKVICENSEIERIQERSFETVHTTKNPEKRCADLPGLSLDPWVNS